MPFFSHGPSIPDGWVQAPGDVQAEIFLVWQEDELPDELKNAPGYVPFTLSSSAEDWVRAMAEIKEIDGSREKIIIGHPRPPAPVRHRSLIPEPAPAAPHVSAAVWEPGMAAKEWIRRQAPRQPPDVAVRTEPAISPRRPAERTRPYAPPAIGQTDQESPVRPTPPAAHTRPVPQIGPAEEPSMSPERESSRDAREKARQVPDIGPP